jgi:hypothetical protein
MEVDGPGWLKPIPSHGRRWAFTSFVGSSSTAKNGRFCHERYNRTEPDGGLAYDFLRNAEYNKMRSKLKGADSGRIEEDFTPHFISLERSEESKQSVVGFKSRCGLAGGSQFLQGLLLNEKVGLNVAMRSLNVLMAQPQGDYRDVHSRLQQMESARMSKQVRTNVFIAETRATCDGSLGDLLQNVVNTVARQR